MNTKFFITALSYLYFAFASCAADNSREIHTKQLQLFRYHQLCFQLNTRINELKKLHGESTTATLLANMDALQQRCRLLEGDYRTCLNAKGDRITLDRIAREYVLAIDNLASAAKEYQNRFWKAHLAIADTLSNISDLADSPTFFNNIRSQQNYFDTVGREYNNRVKLLQEYSNVASPLLQQEMQSAPANTPPDDLRYQQVKERAAHELLRKKSK